MKGPRFYTRSGKLSAYALACGYVEQWEQMRNPKHFVKLWREHGCYHVRHHADHVRVFWEATPSLTVAHKMFAARVRVAKGKP